MKGPRWSRLRQRVLSLCAERLAVENALFAGPPMVRGCLVRQWRVCGSAACRCHRDRRARHGPYWFWSLQAGSRTRLIYVRPEDVGELTAKTHAFRRFWRGLTQLRRVNAQVVTLLDTLGEGAIEEVESWLKRHRRAA